MNKLITKPLPYNQEAEISVLAAILRDGKTIFTATAFLMASNFYSKRHQQIFKAMNELGCNDKDIDILSVCEQIKHNGLLEEAGGIDYLSELEDAVPTSQAISHHCKIVKDKAVLRALIKTGQELSLKAWEEAEDPTDLIEETQNKIYELALTQDTRGGIKHVFSPAEMAQFSFDRTVEWMENSSPIRGIATGMNRLDLAFSGLKDMNIISASTGVGKTAMGLNWAVNIGIRQKVPCLYLNYEMNSDELLIRIQGILSGIPTSNILSGNYNDKYPFSKIGKAAELIRDGKLFITGNQPKSINTTASLIHRYKAQHNIGVVFIDYLGEIEPDKLSEKENAEYRTYGRWAQRLKNICTSLGIKLVLLAQLNRDGEDDPKMSRVGGSWKIAQKADTFLIIKNEKGRPLLWVAKNRNGKEKFGIDIDFDKETQRIVELD